MKVLIVSHNCFSATQNMGKTLASLFSEFEKDEVMQLYLYPTLPNIKKYDNYFRITDNDALKSIFNRKRCGRKILPEEIREENSLFESQGEAQSYSSIKKKNGIVRRARDLVWGFAAWKSKSLKEWLKEGKPDVVFFASGDAVFSQKIAMWISKFLQIPLVTYVCDEYYFTYKKAPFLKRIVNAGLVKSIAKLQRKAAHSFTICETLGRVYKKEFGTPYTLAMTGSSFVPNDINNYLSSNQISYIGNTGLNRFKNLLLLDKTIKQINSENGFDYRLVYYGSKNEQLEGIVKYGGCLNNSEVREVMKKSFMLVHTETFEEEFTNRLRYSVSTKIADSLASGTPILAFGPKELASMQHLIDNECAICITEEKQLKEKLLSVFNQTVQLNDIVEKALKTALDQHNSVMASRKIKSVLEKI